MSTLSARGRQLHEMLNEEANITTLMADELLAMRLLGYSLINGSVIRVSESYSFYKFKCKAI